MTTEQWRDCRNRALSVRCPAVGCQSEVGEPCVVTRGKRKGDTCWPHEGRIVLRYQSDPRTEG